MKIQRKPILLLSTVILITVFQNCENSFQSLSDEVSMASDSMQSIAQSKIPSYIIQIDDSKDLSCPATGTTGSYKLSTENRQKIQLAESSSNQNRHLIIHPQPIEFATSNKSWTDIYRSNFSEIKNTFKKSESSFKIGTAMSLFALEGGSNICQIEQQLNDAFTQAEAHDIPLLVHVDFEWMIDLRPDIWDLNQNPDNKDKIEWSDWNTPIQKFVIFWNEAGIQRKSKVCFSSPEIREEVVKKGRFIAAVINKWRMRLVEKNKSYLFLGVDPGWETGIPDYRKVARAKAQGIDYELGYCSLHHEGYSQSNPPTNKNAVLADVVRKYAEMEAQIFFEAGLPRNKIFTHIIGNDGDINSGPYPGTETTQHSPIEVAFNSYSTPGFSLYPNSYYPELIKQHTQGQDWAITETAFDNFNHLNTFAGDPRLKSINIYSWDLVKINSQSVNALMSLMSYPLNTSTQPQTTPPVVTPTPTPVATPTPPAETNKVLIGAVESMSGSTISGWACIPGASILQIQIHAGDFYGAKNLIAVTTTGQSKSAMTTSCSGNAVSGFSYQFTDADKKNYEGKDIHIKAVSGDRELWLYKPAAYVVPHQPSTTLVGAVENMTGSIIYGWACFPSAASVQIQIYAGDFEGAKNLVALTSTGISKPAASSICSGNTLAGFSYQFNEADKRSYQGKAIHIKALYGGKEIWLYKPAAYIMPSVQ